MSLKQIMMATVMMMQMFQEVGIVNEAIGYMLMGFIEEDYRKY